MSTPSDRLACPHCPVSSRTFTVHGLKVHIGRVHKDVARSRPRVPPAQVFIPSQTSHSGGIGGDTPRSAASLLESLATLKGSVPVLRHIPKGARRLAAGKMCEVVCKCIETNATIDWCALLTFAYSALKAPDLQGPGNLTTKVKSNIDSVLDCPIASFSGAPSPRGLPSVVRTIESKVFEGDLRGAARVLLSEDTVAAPGPETLASLQEKHPSPSRPLTLPQAPDSSTPALKVKEEDVVQALNSFHNGSAAGLDGIRSALLKEMISTSAGDNGRRLLKTLVDLCNFLLSGKLNPEVCPYLYGASLCALAKKGGGIRPIAVGSIFRRLVAKLGCRAVRAEIAEYLQPHQLGFGTKLGCEAAIHATRAFVADPRNADSVIIKLDVKNAFNSIERDTLLSEVGAQQGDPLGPLIFSLGIHKIVTSLKSPLNLWYLDDGTIGGKPEVVTQDLLTLLPRFKELGLEVNASKCEFFCCGPTSHSFSLFSPLLPGLREMSRRTFSLLGSPVFPEGIPEAIEIRRLLLVLAQERLRNISSHVALTLLRVCFAVPKIVYLLRTAPTWLYPGAVSSFDTTLKCAVETLLNVSLNEDQWSQASLPIRYGGLGVRRVGDVSFPAFLASVHGVAGLVSDILSTNGDGTSIPNAAEALMEWVALYPKASLPSVPEVQRAWDDVGAKGTLDRLIGAAAGADLARLRAVSRAVSGAWLQALPSPYMGTLLDSDSMRVAVGLRLGCNVCETHRCVCGSTVEANGHHALSCCRCSGRFPRHHALNDIVRRALISANIPCVLEPPGLSRCDGKKPDGLTMVPWQRGKCLVWDATCVSTFAASHLGSTVRTAGAAAEAAALKKRDKYSVLAGSYLFVPLAFETTGCWGSEALAFVMEVGRRLRESGGDARSGSYLSQRLSIAIQRGNAMSVMGTFASGSARND